VPVRIVGTGLALVVRLTPRAASNALDGMDVLADGTRVLKARVRAVPEDGKANAALVKLLAQSFSLPLSAVELTAGHKGRVKTVALRVGDAEAQRIIGEVEKLGRS
jgi:uncharacterized protein